jgi:translation initiation factor 1 (eIF-1/SUI1)
MPSAYLEQAELAQFFEITESNNHLLIRRGAVGQACLVFHVPFATEGKALHQLERLVAAWKDLGFAASVPAHPITEGAHVHTLIGADIEPDSHHAQIFDVGGGARLREGRRRIYHLRDGLQANGNLDFEVFADMGLGSAVIIDGDVRLSGVLSQLSYTYPSPILIFGNVFAHSLAHRDSHLAIEGNLTVDNIVYGEYNDGSLYINGEVRGAAWISQDHDMDAAKLLLPVFSDDDEYEGLHESLIDEEDGLDTDAVREHIWAGTSPLADGFKYQSTPQPERKLAPVPSTALSAQMRELAMRDDPQGMVALLERWPTEHAPTEHAPTEEWLMLIGARLIAPSTSAAQKERLQALRISEPAERARASVTQVPGYAQSDADVQKIVSAMTGALGGARAEKLYLQDPPGELSLLRHSQVLMANVLLKDGVRADGTDSLLCKQSDVVALVQQLRPAVTVQR